MRSKTAGYKRQWSVNIHYYCHKVQRGSAVILQNQNCPEGFNRSGSLVTHIQGFAAVIVMHFVVTVLWPWVVREKCGLNLVKISGKPTSMLQATFLPSFISSTCKVHDWNFCGLCNKIIYISIISCFSLYNIFMQLHHLVKDDS
jgi:hypothetical protein